VFLDLLSSMVKVQIIGVGATGSQIANELLHLDRPMVIHLYDKDPRLLVGLLVGLIVGLLKPR